MGVTNKDKLFTISLKTKAGPLESDILYYLNWGRGLRVDFSKFFLVELRTSLDVVVLKKKIKMMIPSDSYSIDCSY